MGNLKKFARRAMRAWRPGLRRNLRQRHIGSSCDSLSPSCPLHITRVCSLPAVLHCGLRCGLWPRCAQRRCLCHFSQHASLPPFCCKPCAAARSQARSPSGAAAFGRTGASGPLEAPAPLGGGASFGPLRHSEHAQVPTIEHREAYTSHFGQYVPFLDPNRRFGLSVGTHQYIG
jgi:hypothetical protein